MMFLLYIFYCEGYLHGLNGHLSTLFMQNKDVNNNNNNKNNSIIIIINKGVNNINNSIILAQLHI